MPLAVDFLQLKDYANLGFTIFFNLYIFKLTYFFFAIFLFWFWFDNNLN
jgi:hypothetical protein